MNQNIERIVMGETNSSSKQVEPELKAPESEDIEICPVCKNEVPLDSLLSYNNIPNAFCQDCVDSGRV